ncbi:hypothetical protein V491_03917 [Pseudogymnoascus sp. VKM F-3775]|nr:hypothetical protein V491_03917 [Pseudogymnoascus sp. VKM F-3775]
MGLLSWDPTVCDRERPGVLCGPATLAGDRASGAGMPLVLIGDVDTVATPDLCNVGDIRGTSKNPPG